MKYPERPSWVWDWICIQPWWFDFSARLSAISHSEGERKRNIILIDRELGLNIFELEHGQMFINVPDTAETAMFVLSHQPLTNAETA